MKGFNRTWGWGCDWKCCCTRFMLIFKKEYWRCTMQCLVSFICTEPFFCWLLFLFSLRCSNSDFRYSFAKIIFGSASLSVLKLSHNCATPLVARCGCWCKQMPLTEMVSWAGAWAWFLTVPSPSSGPREEDRSYSRPLLSPKPLSRKYLTWEEPWTLISANQVSVWRLTMRNLYTSLR